MAIYDYCDDRTRYYLNKGEYHYFIEEGEKERKPMLKTLSARLKRALNKNLEAMYKLGWIDGDLELTGVGKNKLVEILLDKFEDEIGAVAIKEVKKIKEEQE